jgi:hypothetical protein
LGVKGDISCPPVMQAEVAPMHEPVPEMVMKSDMEGWEGWTACVQVLQAEVAALLEQVQEARGVTREYRITWVCRGGPS